LFQIALRLDNQATAADVVPFTREPAPGQFRNKRLCSEWRAEADRHEPVRNRVVVLKRDSVNGNVSTACDDAIGNCHKLTVVRVDFEADDVQRFWKRNPMRASIVQQS